MESNGLRKWQEADRWHGANCYAGIPSHGPAIFTRFCLWGKSYLGRGRASYSVSQLSLAHWRNSIFGMGLAVTGGLDQRGKQREPEGPAEISRCAQVTGLDMRKSDEPRKGRWIHARCFSPCPAGFLYYIVHSIKMGSARPLYDRRGKSRSGKPSAFGGPITRTPASRCWLMIWFQNARIRIQWTFSRKWCAFCLSKSWTVRLPGTDDRLHLAPSAFPFLLSPFR